jgi:hypothetical protein
MNMSNRNYIGIDCGLDGGIVTLDNVGNILDQIVMPTIKLGKGRKVNLLELCGYIGRHSDRDTTVCVENPGGHAPSAAGLRSMTYSFAVVEAFCVAHRLRYHDVAAKSWQAEFWSRPKMPKNKAYNTKAAALDVCTKLWPTNDWTATERSKKAHDGLTDAALIAEYARRKRL